MESYQIAIIFLVLCAFVIAVIDLIFFSKKPDRFMTMDEMILGQKRLNALMNLSIDGVIMSRGGKVIPRKKWFRY